jgi:hypothetical protein
MSDHYDDGGAEPEATRKDILWFFALVLLIGVTVATIKMVSVVSGIAVLIVVLLGMGYLEHRDSKLRRKKTLRDQGSTAESPVSRSQDDGHNITTSATSANISFQISPARGKRTRTRRR